MSVTEATQALGEWSLRLRSSAPRSIVDQIGYFGHIAIAPGREDPTVAGDSLLSSARYVGVLRGLEYNEDGTELAGAGMAFWLGDEDDKGSVIEDALSFTGESFTQTIRDLLPASGSVTEGSLHAIAGTYTGTHQYQSPRKAITYVCSLFDAEWRVNGDGTLDAGLPEDLYVTDPRAAVIRRMSGDDVDLRALPGAAVLQTDMEDFTTRVVLLASGEGDAVATADADIDPDLNPHVDLHGNPVTLTRLVSESQTGAPNADARAQLQLNRFTRPRDALSLTDITHDIRGDVAVGDYVWVHDPDSGLFDLGQEVVFHGERLNPVKLRVTEMTWPIEKSMGVYYRTQDGDWLDLTDHVVFESGQTRVTVGGYARSLTAGGGFTEPVGSRPVADSSIPGVPVFVTPFEQSIYQSDFGVTRAQIDLVWEQPLNTDSSPIIDGDHYEIRYRTSSTPVDPITWSQAAAGTWGDLHTWGNPLGLSDGPWTSAYVAFDFEEFQVGDLLPGRPYEFQIRAVDGATPPNYGDWSESETVQTAGDTIEPSTPAAPVVAASQIAVLIEHSLGKSTGGTFNLEPDLDHLEVHLGSVSTFTPSGSTLLGYITATAANLLGEIKAIKSFQVSQTTQVYIKVIAVDASGNRSNPSDAAGVTAQLIDSSHIQSLVADKIDAGTLAAALILGGEIATATSGNRVRFFAGGIEAFSSGGIKTVNISSTDASFELKSADSGARIRVASAAGIEAYNSGGVKTVSLANDGTFELRSGSSGARVSLTPTSGLETYNSGGVKTVSLAPNGTFELKSADSGGRINLTTTGYRAYGSNGNLRVQILNDGSFKLFDTDGTTATLTADATTGDLAILGELRTGTGGRRIDIGRNSSDRSEIQMYSTNTSSTHGYAALSTREFSNETAIYLRSSLTETSYPRAELVLHPEWSRFSRQTAADNFDVGFNSSGVLVAYNQVTLIHQDETTGDVASLGLGDGGLSASAEAGALFSMGTSGIYLSGGGSGQGIQVDTATPICRLTDGTGSARFGIDASSGTGPTMRLFWNGSSYQFVRTDTNSVVKTFIIDHPVDPDRYLIHATTESPHNGVEYWGEAVIKQGKAEVSLPGYFEALCAPENRQVQVSVVLPDEDMSRGRGKDVEVDALVAESIDATSPAKKVKQVKKKMEGAPEEPEAFMLWPVAASTPRNGKFRIACAGPDGTRVAWLVKAVRKDVAPLLTEPLKTDVVVQGDGPYKYYTLPKVAPGTVKKESK